MIRNLRSENFTPTANLTLPIGNQIAVSQNVKTINFMNTFFYSKIKLWLLILAMFFTAGLTQLNAQCAPTTSVGGNQCATTAVTLTTPGTAATTVRWQFSLNGGVWTNIAGSNANVFGAGALSTYAPAGGSLRFRAEHATAADNCASATTVFTDPSGNIEVFVRGTHTTAALTFGTNPICLGQSTVISKAGAITSNANTTWQLSINGGATYIIIATGATNTFPYTFTPFASSAYLDVRFRM